MVNCKMWVGLQPDKDVKVGRASARQKIFALRVLA